MPVRETFPLNVKTSATGAGTEITCKDLIDKCVQIGPLTGGRKVRIEGTLGVPSNAPSGWVEQWDTAVAGIVTPGGIFSVDKGYVKIRLFTEVLGSGDTQAILSGLNVAREP